MTEPRYPDITVSLAGGDGNAFAILGKVNKALRNAGVDKTEIDEYTAQATSSDYDNLLATTMQWVDVE